MDELKYKVHETGINIDEAIRKILALQFMTAPTATNKVATNADLPTIPLSGLLKADGNGDVTAAVAGEDYQTPLWFKTAPSPMNKLLTESDAVHDIAFANAAPINGTTSADSIGALYCHVISEGHFDYYTCIDTETKSWVKLFSVAPNIHTDVITSSGTWTAPESINQAFNITVIGAGGGQSSSFSSGASAGCLSKGTFTIAEGENISVIVASAPSADANGGASSFGSYLTANGGRVPTSNDGASAISDGGMGGGGGSDRITPAGAGGNGGTYGGGGGGGNTKAGGNGGTYGGGGGGGKTATAGGDGGTYGGAGGFDSSAGSNGTNTIGLGLDFEGTGAGGVAGAAGSGGAGGGGYGGQGGNAGTASLNGRGGAGGGGYGGNGADVISNGRTQGGGGGGGGYGGQGSQGNEYGYGGGGGGYGLSNYGKGSDGVTNNPSAGAVIVSYATVGIVWS